MLVARVVGDEIEHDLQPARTRVGDERIEVGERPESGWTAWKSETSYPQSAFGDGWIGVSQIASTPSHSR